MCIRDRMYTQDAEIIRLGEIYFRFSVITYFFLGLSLVCTIILRCVGQVKLPLLVSIGAFFVNLLANYVFIFGKLGMPRMGIAGAALGTLIARLFEAGKMCIRDRLRSQHHAFHGTTTKNLDARN